MILDFYNSLIFYITHTGSAMDDIDCAEDMAEPPQTSQGDALTITGNPAYIVSIALKGRPVLQLTVTDVSSTTYQGATS